MPKLSKTFLDKLASDPAEGERFVWDSDLKGFGVRIKKSGSASFLILDQERRLPHRSPP